MLNLEEGKPLKNKKFDLRQWVLVKSFNPLEIFMFSSCYLRLCSENFDVNDIKNLNRHLTNFSLNKNKFQSLEESIFSLEDFKILIKNHLNKNWELDVLPSIENLIIMTLKSATDSLEANCKCFELYGFDILLDEKLRPWLIEVNLSPACCERAEW